MLHSRPVVLIILIVTFDLRLCDRCSQRKAMKRDFIHFGRQSARGEWPWHAAMFHQIDSAHPSYVCGGTIVSRTFIITAAHCTYPSPRVRPLQASEILVRVGISNIRQLEDSFQEMLVTKILRHGDYDMKTSYNDIALLQLVAELKFTDYVNSICLWRGNDEEDEIVGKEGFVPGWGKEENDLIPDILKLAVMPIVSRKACQESDPIYYTKYLFDRRTFCAGFRNGTSVGPGDSGSGLYIQINEEWLLRGIVSNGKFKPSTRMLDTENYIVFTDVAYYIKWIRTEINLQNAGGLDPIHVEECAVCGEKIESPYSRPGLQYTRTWPWKASIYYIESKLHNAVILSEYILLSPGTERETGLFSSRSFSAKAVFESDQSVEIGSQPINRVFQNKYSTTYIALWKMKTPLKCTTFIQPICLFREDPYNEKSKRLNAYTTDVEVILDSNICTELFFKETSTMGNYSFCFRMDQTSHLPAFTYIKRDNIWYLYGTPSVIRTYNESAMDRYVFSHYISHYKDWIDSHILNARLNVLEIENCSPIEQFVYKLYSEEEFRCFATQITPGILITTALCVDNQLSRNLSCQSENGSRVYIDKIYLHPFYDKARTVNNIALVQHCSPISQESICVPTFPGKNPNLSLPTRLSTIIADNYSQNITLTDTELCAQDWKRAGVTVVADGSYICGRMPVVDSTRPNSCADNLHGMPLLYSEPDAKGIFLRGILDIGKKDYCKDDGLPDVYIDKTHYTDWIIEQVDDMETWCIFGKDSQAASKNSMMAKVKAYMKSINEYLKYYL